MYALVKLRKLVDLKSNEARISRIYKDIGAMSITETQRGGDLSYYMIDYIEEDYRLELGGGCELEISVPEGLLVLYIGKVRCRNNYCNYYYLDSQSIEQPCVQSNLYIATSKANNITFMQYLICIVDLIEQAIKQRKRLVIYTDLISSPSKYRSLGQKMINELLAEIGAIAIHKCYGEMNKYYTPVPERFEPYIEYGIYTEDDLNNAINKVNHLLNKGYTYISMRKFYRKES